MQQESSTFEAKILETLDRCLLKMSGILDSRFDPNNPDSIKLLKLFRSTMSVRRTWAKVYDLVPLPASRGTGAHSHSSQNAHKSNTPKTDPGKLNISQSDSLARSSTLPVFSSHLEKVTQILSRPIVEMPANNNGLLLKL